MRRTGKESEGEKGGQGAGGGRRKEEDMSGGKYVM